MMHKLIIKKKKNMLKKRAQMYHKRKSEKYQFNARLNVE